MSSTAEEGPQEEESRKRKMEREEDVESVADAKEDRTESEKKDSDKDRNKKDSSSRAWPSQRKTKKLRAEAKTQHTRRAAKEGKETHGGSYANEEQRKLFNIELPPEEDPDKNATRVKRKVSFLLAYLGTNYSGFQINEGQRTLQGDFELAMLKCHFLMPSNFGHPYKYGWSTSGRTDKGVHACAQVGSAKIELLPHQTMDDVRQELNAVLPADFRVLDVKRTTRNFCAHTQRDRVRYQYMIPSFLFCDIAKVRSIFQEIGATTNGRPLADPLSDEEIAKVTLQLKKGFRATAAHLDLLRKALACYQGTHSFHNFTKGIKASEARATRYIEYFRVEDPIVFEDGTEWVPTQVLGQSFLIHQIRKMVCMAIDITRGGAPLDTINRALAKNSDIRIATAPAQGLYLDMSFYGGYNRRKQMNADLLDLDWTNEESDEFKRWKEFRNGVVMKHVVDEEAREGNFVRHLFVQEFGFDYHQFYQLHGKRPGDNLSPNQEADAIKES